MVEVPKCAPLHAVQVDGPAGADLSDFAAVFLRADEFYV